MKTHVHLLYILCRVNPQKSQQKHTTKELCQVSQPLTLVYSVLYDHCLIFFFLSEGLIRVAFQSLQLVVTDFLPLMPCTCIKVVVDVAGKFGLQPQELNISLTAIGLLVSYHVTVLLGFCW